MNREELKALAETVQKLTGPDREVNTAIEKSLPCSPDFAKHHPRKVMSQWNERAFQFYGLGDEGHEYASPSYTASLDAAMSLVPRGWIVALYRDFNNDGEYWSRCKLTNSFTIGRGCDESEEVSVTSSVGEKRNGDDPTVRALTAAALLARAEQMGEGE